MRPLAAMAGASAAAPCAPSSLPLRLSEVRDLLTKPTRFASTKASVTPNPLSERSSDVRQSARSSLSGMPLKLSRVGMASTASASCCAPSPLISL